MISEAVSLTHYIELFRVIYEKYEVVGKKETWEKRKEEGPQEVKYTLGHDTFKRCENQ